MCNPTQRAIPRLITLPRACCSWGKLHNWWQVLFVCLFFAFFTFLPACQRTCSHLFYSVSKCDSEVGLWRKNGKERWAQKIAFSFLMLFQNVCMLGTDPRLPHCLGFLMLLYQQLAWVLFLNSTHICMLDLCNPLVFYNFILSFPSLCNFCFQLCGHKTFL